MPRWYDGWGWTSEVPPPVPLQHGAYAVWQRRRLAERYLVERADSLDDGLARCATAVAERRPLSVGVIANAAKQVLSSVHRRCRVPHGDRRRDHDNA